MSNIPLGLTKVKFPQYPGFDEFLDDTGNKIYRNKQTGKWVDCISVDMPVGGRVFTPQQVESQDSYRERGKQIEAEKAAEQKTREYNLRSSFYFALSKDRRADGIKPQTLARVFFLATFLRYDDDKLYSKDGLPLTKKDVAELLKLGSNTFKGFWKEAVGKYIFEQEDGSIAITNEFFRGAKTPIFGLFVHDFGTNQLGIQHFVLESVRNGQGKDSNNGSGRFLSQHG